METINQSVSSDTGKKKGKKAKVAGAAALAAVLALSSTFAWTSFSQQATNEFRAEANAGGRLHDDFSFTQAKQNKDIYVENFTSETDGSPIFARVQLKEYLEIGPRAGQPESADKTVTRFPESAVLNNQDNWSVHKYGDTTSEYATRFTWTEGGSTTFMPTFNKNKDSVEADINGSFRDEGGPYTNYKEYTLDQTLDGTAIYDADDNDVDEKGEGVVDVNFTETPETHTAKATGEGTVMSMADWKDAGSKAGPYWVYDTDGWAYWAQAIQPGEATGLLLNNVELKTSIPDTWYYAIHATGEFVSNGEWKQDGTTYYMDQAASKPISSDAFTLLNAAADALTAASWVNQLASAALLTDTEAGEHDKCTVSINGVNYYKLVQDGDNVLVSLADTLGKKQFDPTTHIWRDSAIRAWLNGAYYDSLDSELRDRIVKSTIQTFDPVGNEMISTEDSIFILSKADYVGSSFNPSGGIIGNNSDYTYANTPIYTELFEEEMMRSATADGKYEYIFRNDARAVEPSVASSVVPAMWISVA